MGPAACDVYKRGRNLRLLWRHVDQAQLAAEDAAQGVGEGERGGGIRLPQRSRHGLILRVELRDLLRKRRS